MTLVFGRSIWLGEPLTIPLHRLENGALLLFTFFMRRSEASRPIAVAVVSQTRPSATTGDDQPRPVTGTFHATFCVSLHWVGTACSLECP